jgi:hypothetical protein
MFVVRGVIRGPIQCAVRRSGVMHRAPISFHLYYTPDNSTNEVLIYAAITKIKSLNVIVA